MVENGINAISNIIPDRATHDTSQNGNGGQAAPALDYPNSLDLLPLDPELVRQHAGPFANADFLGNPFLSFNDGIDFLNSHVLASRIPSHQPPPDIFKTSHPPKTASTTESTTRLKVVTVNAFSYHENGLVGVFYDTPRYKERIDLLAQWLKKEGPDVVFLQEVWQKKGYERLKEVSGYAHGIYFSDLGNGNSDLAILSRYPLDNFQFTPTQWQGSSKVECARDVGIQYRVGLATATVHVNGQEILLANFHPMHRRESEEGFNRPYAELTPERMIQLIEMSLLFVSQIQGRPYLMAGDFNYNHSQAEAKIVDLFGFQDSCEELDENPLEPDKMCTFCRDNPLNNGRYPGEKIIDHVYASSHFKIVQAQIAFPEVVFTDHQPVIADVEVRSDQEMERFRELWGFEPGALIGPENFHRDLLTVLGTEGIEKLEKYFQEVSFHVYCLASELGPSQTENTLALIKELKRGVARASINAPFQGASCLMAP